MAFWGVGVGVGVAYHSVSIALQIISMFASYTVQWMPSIRYTSFCAAQYPLSHVNYFGTNLFYILIVGFAGYFDATLYKDMHLGNEPSRATPGVFTWY